MRMSMGNLAVAVIVVSLVGCATPAPSVSVLERKQVIDVNEISISNLSMPTEKDESGVFTSRFIKLADSNTDPPFSVLVYESLRKGLIPAKGADSKMLDVMLLRADLLMEIRTADSIPFIGIASTLSDREFACRIELNFKLGTVNERKVFESKATHNRAWSDLETVKKKDIIERCVDQTVKNAAVFANEFVQKIRRGPGSAYIAPQHAPRHPPTLGGWRPR